MRCQLGLLLLLASVCQAQDQQLLWGDLHVHTSYSMDAFSMGTRLTPTDAYRFARGEPLTLADGSSAQLARPLDFVAITDHAETFGIMNVCTGAAADHPYCTGFARLSDGKSFDAFREYFLPALFHNKSLCGEAGLDCAGAQRSMWQRVIDEADAANEPGTFTAFVANEWSLSPGNLHWHRNLIYRTSTVPERPINALDEPDAVALWRALDERCAAVAGCDVLAIPHNSNLGLGGTFAIAEASTADLLRRSRFEKLIEVHQHKGQSECYPGSTLSDEACDFEVRLPIPIARQGTPPTLEQQQQIASGYIRQALAEGLQRQQRDGLNSLRYGFVGATDTHSARPGDVDEEGWKGGSGRFDLDATNRAQLIDNNPGGLTGVWAEANTRDAVFAALKRRHSFATSGPRIALRFFASFETRKNHCRDRRNRADVVAMGAVMPATGTRRAPQFYVEAMKDQAPLERIELIKLSVEGDTVVQTITPVTLARRQQTQACVRIPDEAFNPQGTALWYVRVLQQPTPSWRQLPDGSPQLVAERAWSSPIWYEP